MAKHLSEDLRDPGYPGRRGRHVALRRRVGSASIASAVRWMDATAQRQTAAKQHGGDRRSGRIEAQADLLLGAIEQTPDMTLAELRERLIGARRGFRDQHDPDFYRRRGVTYKKRPRTPASRSARM